MATSNVLQDFNGYFAQILVGGNTEISGLILVVVFSSLIMMMMASAKAPIQVMLLPFLFMALIGGALGWIGADMVIVIVLIVAVLTASIVSKNYGG